MNTKKNKLTPEELIAAVRGLSSSQKDTFLTSLGLEEKEESGYEKFSSSEGFNKTIEQLSTGHLKYADIVQEIYTAELKFLKDITNAGAAYQANFETGGKFQRAMENTMIASEKFYASTEIGSGVFKGLTTSMKSFVSLSEDTITTLAKNATHFQQLGLDASKLGEILDTAVLSYQENENSLESLSRKIMTMSINLAMPPTELATNFSQAQKSMAYSSSKLMDIFGKLQAKARFTGVDFNSLTSAFGETMDTFEGSAQVAGRLNAVLGDSVFNSIELLSMNEAQRADTIIKRVQGKIGDVSQLGKFELKAIASSMGMSVDDTRRILSGKSTVERELQKLAGGPGTEMKDANKMVAKEMEAFRDIIRSTRSDITNINQEYYAGVFDIEKKLKPHRRRDMKRYGIREKFANDPLPENLLEIENEALYMTALMLARTQPGFSAELSKRKVNPKELRALVQRYREHAKPGMRMGLFEKKTLRSGFEMRDAASIEKDRQAGAIITAQDLLFDRAPGATPVIPGLVSQEEKTLAKELKDGKYKGRAKTDAEKRLATMRTDRAAANDETKWQAMVIRLWKKMGFDTWSKEGVIRILPVPGRARADSQKSWPP